MEWCIRSEGLFCLETGSFPSGLFLLCVGVVIILMVILLEAIDWLKWKLKMRRWSKGDYSD